MMGMTNGLFLRDFSLLMAEQYLKHILPFWDRYRTSQTTCNNHIHSCDNFRVEYAVQNEIYLIVNPVTQA